MEQEQQVEAVQNDAANEVEQEVTQMQLKLQEALRNSIGSKKEEEKEEEVVGEQPEPQPESDEVEEGEASENPEEKEEKKEEEFPVIPNDWTAEEKERFQSALDNPELKDQASVLIDRYNNLKKGFYKKAEEGAELKKQVSAWNDIFDDNAKAQLNKNGFDEHQYVQHMMSVDRRLSTEPAAVINELMEAYKVSPDQLGLAKGESSDDSYFDYDNEINQLKNEVTSLKSQLKGNEAARINQEQVSVQSQLRDFEHSIDENGDPLYPLFNEVKEEMAILIQAGKANDLKEAYNKAPTVVKSQLERQAEIKSKKDLEADRKKVADAKRASRGITNKVSSPSPVKRSGDIRADLMAAFKQHGFR